MLLGDAVRRHPGSRLSAVEVGRHIGAHGSMVDFLALVEGIPDHDIAGLLLAWNLRYGEPAQVLGGPFALRLPVAVDALPNLGLSSILRSGGGVPTNTVVVGDHIQAWFACPTPGEAAQLAQRLRKALRGVDGAQVEARDPTPEDLECWGLLRLAAEVGAQAIELPA
jgi:hypothetical protein